MHRQPIEDLCVLLCDLFSPDEFRAWARGGPDSSIDLELPGDAAPHARVVRDAVSYFARRGLIEREFFARLHELRPYRAKDIRECERRWTRVQSGPIPHTGHERHEFRIGHGRREFRLLALATSATILLGVVFLATVYSMNSPPPSEEVLLSVER